MIKLFLQHREFTAGDRRFYAFAWAMGGLPALAEPRLLSNYCLVEARAVGQEFEACSDAFLSCWRTIESFFPVGPLPPVMVHCSLRAVSQALEAVADTHYPTMSVVSGAGRLNLAEEWFRVIDLLAEAERCFQPQGCAVPPLHVKNSEPGGNHYVVATDASKRGGHKAAGWGYASTSGHMNAGVINCKDIVQAEFFAAATAIEHFLKKGATRLEVLTDSLPVVKIFQGSLRRSIVDQELLERTLALIEEARGRGIYIAVLWVKGHSGHVLNEIADRLARNKRRCHEWSTDKESEAFIKARIKADLAAGISGLSPLDFLPVRTPVAA